jgi:hypothetical protein
MAAKSGSGARILVVAVVASFIGGCWVGMGSDSSGDAYCVVTMASAPARPGFSPGQFVERTGDGCQPGEPVVCGTYEPESGDDREFVADECPDD